MSWITCRQRKVLETRRSRPLRRSRYKAMMGTASRPKSSAEGAKKPNVEP